MITSEMRAEMRRLVLVERWRIETVARRFGVHHSTVRRALANQLATDEKAPQSALDPHKPFIVERITDHPALTAVRLLAEIKQRGYALGIVPLRRYLAKVRPPRSRKVYLRVEVDPGEQAQVDWGHFGHFRVGNAQRPLSAFSMVLSWSRAIFVDFSLDQRLETFVAMHRRALEFFGGVPKHILYDNLKSVVLHHIGQTVQFNPRFLDFASHYLFELRAAPVRYPEAKGRVENSIKYLRQSFFYGRSFASLVDLRAQAQSWRDQTANDRLHATTRERPADRLLIERERLRKLPEHPYDTDLRLPLIVSKEARVQLDSNTYSVPPSYVGQSVLLRADDTTIRILFEGKIIACHDRSWDRRKAIEDPAHIRELVERRKGAQGPKLKDRLAALSPEARLYLQEVARRRINLDSEMRKLARMLMAYGDTELAGAMAKALAQRTIGARFVRALMDQARFARGLSEPPEPVVTGHSFADSLDVQPHPMESYDALFDPAPKGPGSSS